MTGKKKLIILICGICAAVFAAAVIYIFFPVMESRKDLRAAREEMLTKQGTNKELTGKDYDRENSVTCDNGTFVGSRKDGVKSFKGIPYAKPPVGSLRWKPPVDAEPGDGIYEAYYFGKSGIQTEAETERASLYLQGEDCLTLNIWTQEGRDPEEAEKRAVMVFFPGGGYGWGGTADPIYDGQNFVRAHGDIVLVTVNYRIGLMGFMDFSEVEGGEEFSGSGNLGLLDQICALRWVRRNIARFGGDPDNVTIFGESAGASSVSFIPLIDEAKGLFRRAIAQSGSLAFSFSREESRTLTRKLMKLSGASSMEELMALDEAELMKLNEKLNDYNNFPERDGIVLPEDVYAAYASGKASWADMLTGTNADETRYWIGEVGGYPIYLLAGRLLYGSITERMDEDDRLCADAFLALIQGKSIWKKTAFMNDLLFRVPAIRQAELHTESGGRDYMYYWTKQSAIPHYGACHAIELAYVFNNTQDTIFTGEPADEKLAETVQEMWVNYAKTGDPSTEEYSWECYEREERQTMFLGDEIRMISDPFPQQRVLVEPLLKYRFNGYYRAADYALIYLRDRAVRTVFILILAAGVLFGEFRLRKWMKKRQ